MFQKERLEEALKLLESVYAEIRQDRVDEEATQAAVNCQVEINRIMFAINEPEIRRMINRERCEDAQ